MFRSNSAQISLLEGDNLSLANEPLAADGVPGELYDDDALPGVARPIRRDLLGNKLAAEPVDERALRHAAQLAPGTPVVILDGDAGTGKSVSLLQTVLWARTNGWLAVYVTDADELLNAGEQISENEFFEGQYDQVTFAFFFEASFLFLYLYPF